MLTAQGKPKFFARQKELFSIGLQKSKMCLHSTFSWEQGLCNFCTACAQSKYCLFSPLACIWWNKKHAGCCLRFCFSLAVLINYPEHAWCLLIWSSAWMARDSMCTIFCKYRSYVIHIKTVYSLKNVWIGDGCFDMWSRKHIFDLYGVVTPTYLVNLFAFATLENLAQVSISNELNSFGSSNWWWSAGSFTDSVQANTIVLTAKLFSAIRVQTKE